MCGTYLGIAGMFCVFIPDATGRGHRRIGGQNLRAVNHMSSPVAAPSPTTITSVSKQ